MAVGKESSFCSLRIAAIEKEAVPSSGVDGTAALVSH